MPTRIPWSPPYWTLAYRFNHGARECLPNLYRRPSLWEILGSGKIRDRKRRCVSFARFVSPAGSYIGDLEEVFLASKEYLEAGGVLAFTCELVAAENCDATKASVVCCCCTHCSISILVPILIPILIPTHLPIPFVAVFYAPSFGTFFKARMYVVGELRSVQQCVCVRLSVDSF